MFPRLSEWRSAGIPIHFIDRFGESTNKELQAIVNLLCVIQHWLVFIEAPTGKSERGYYVKTEFRKIIFTVPDYNDMQFQLAIGVGNP